MTDEELQALRDEAKAARAEAKAARDENKRFQQGYAADMNIIGAELTKRAAPAAPVAQAAAVEEDDGEFTVEKVNRLIDQKVDQRISQPAAQIGQSLMHLTRQQVAASSPDFQRYAGEVDSLVARAVQANPAVATDPRLYQNSLDIVRLQHQDEIVEERTQAALKQRLRDDYGVEEDETDDASTGAAEVEAASAPPTQQAQARRQFAEAPTPPGGGRTLPPLRRRGAPTISEEQDFVNQRVGFKPAGAQQFDQYADQRYSPDILGLRGRERV